MNHHLTVALAQQRQAELLSDGARSRRRSRRARTRSVRSWLTRDRQS
jgi:hypothetical protein